jgi:hypothetical protein
VTLTLEGNVFYENTATATAGYPVIRVEGGGSGSVSSRGYNVVDMALGTSNNTQSGFNNTNDRTLTQLSITGSPFTGVTAGAADATGVASSALAPVNGIQNVMPNAAITGFPTTDFFGVSRSWPGAAGAVNGN